MEEEEYLSELEQVRSKGYSVDDEEYLTGVSAVAVALNNTHGPPMALWAVGLSSNMDFNKLNDAVGIMTGAAEELRGTIDNAMGY